jgi:hypothetical protein
MAPLAIGSTYVAVRVITIGAIGPQMVPCPNLSDNFANKSCQLNLVLLMFIPLRYRK